MAENKKVQIKNTGGDALYPRTAAENIVNVPGGTMNVFMYLNGYGAENQFPDPYKGDRYFDSAAHKVYECVTDTTWTGKKEITSWDSNTLFFWNGNVWKYTDSEEGPLSPVLCASVDQSVTNGVNLNGGNGSPLKVIASSATASQLGTVKVTTTASNGAALSITNGAVKVTMAAATSTGVGAVQLATNAIASSGTNTTQAVTPAGMKNAMTWTKIQNMASSASVTVNPGESYRLMATDGAVHTLNRAANAYAGYNGADAHIQIFLDTVSVINGNNISIMDKLVPSACNNCLVKYRDGEARLYLEDVYAGFTVTVNASDVNASGTVFDGIINWGTSYITFSKQLDGEVIDMNPLYFVDDLNNTGHNSIIVGNGPENTILKQGQKKGAYSLTVVNCKLIDQWVVQKGDLHVVACEFEKGSTNHATLYCGSAGRIFVENCDLTADESPNIGLSGPARGTYILRNCKIDRYSIHSSSTIAFAGSNSLKGSETGDAAKPTQTMLIERGAVVNISGNTNADTATIVSAGSGIKVVSNASATSPSLGGAAIIRSHRKPGYMAQWPEGNPEPWGMREDAGLNNITQIVINQVKMSSEWVELITVCSSAGRVLFRFLPAGFLDTPSGSGQRFYSGPTDTNVRPRVLPLQPDSTTDMPHQHLSVHQLRFRSIRRGSTCSRDRRYLPPCGTTRRLYADYVQRLAPPDSKFREYALIRCLLCRRTCAAVLSLSQRFASHRFQGHSIC